MGSNALSMVNANLNHRSFVEGDAAVEEVADEHVPAKDASHHRLLDTVRTPPNRERTPLQSSFDSLHGELSKLSTLVSQFAVQMGMKTTEILDSGSFPAVPTQFQSPGTTASRSYMGAAASSSVNSFHSHSDAAASAYVVPEVFDTMPTPSSACSKVFGKQSSAAASSSPSSDRSQFGTSSTANVAPMVFGEMPTPISGHGTQSPPKQTSAAENLRVAAQWFVGAQAEGLATVNCSKTNNSDDYEPRLGHLVKLPIIVQDVPNVKKEMPVHDAYEEEQKDSEQPPKCSSESTKDSLLQVVTGLAFPEEGEAHATRYIKFTHGQDIQEIVVSDLAPGYAKDSACLKITSEVQDFSFGLQQQDDVRACSCPDLEASASIVTSSSQLCIDHSIKELRLLWDPGASTPPSPSKAVILERRKEWDPGDTKFHALFMTAFDATKLQCRDVYKFGSIDLWLQSLTARIATKKPLSRVPIPEPTQWQSQVTSVSFVWDPGIRLLLHKYKWWFVYTEDMTNWYTNIKFNGVALWLFHSLPP